MDKITPLNSPMRYLSSLWVLLLLMAGLFADLQRAEADTCRFTTCGARERILGTPPLYRDPGGRGNRTWNDIYNQRNQQRFQPGIKAQPFDTGSPIDPTKSLVKDRKTGSFNTDNPQARNEHMRWCRQKYRSYVGASDTYTTYDGRTLYCDSPYD